MDRPLDIQRMINLWDEIDLWIRDNHEQALSVIDYPGVLEALSTVFTALRETHLSDDVIGPSLLSVLKAGVFVGTRLSSGWIPGPEDDIGLTGAYHSVFTDEELEVLLGHDD